MFHSGRRRIDTGANVLLLSPSVVCLQSGVFSGVWERGIAPWGSEV